MAVPSSGAISLLGIQNEIDEDNYNAGEEYSNISLRSLEENTDINENSAEAPNGESPFAMSEWYGYDHDAAPSFANTKAVSKALQVGVNHNINLVDTDDTFNFQGSDAWSISFWIKAGWSSSLNTNIHLFIGQKQNASYQLSDMIKVIYTESTNRIRLQYGNS